MNTRVCVDTNASNLHFLILSSQNSAQTTYFHRMRIVGVCMKRDVHRTLLFSHVGARKASFDDLTYIVTKYK